MFPFLIVVFLSSLVDARPDRVTFPDEDPSYNSIDYYDDDDGLLDFRVVGGDLEEKAVATAGITTKMVQSEQPVTFFTSRDGMRKNARRLCITWRRIGTRWRCTRTGLFQL